MAIWGTQPPGGEGISAQGEAQAPAGGFSASAAAFVPMSARRLLIFGGIALVAGGMLFGDIFAVFVLHQNGSQTGSALLAASKAATDQNVSGVKEAFAQIGGLLEDRGTKIDAHVHMTDAGYLALMLALLQPYVALSSERKKQLARVFLAGAVLLPVGIFLIHYVGLAHSPFAAIGWASVLADSAGSLLIIALLGEVWGLWKHARSMRAGTAEPELLQENSWCSRALLSGGTVLILLGFLQGAWYAGIHLYEHEGRETRILKTMVDEAGVNDLAGVGLSVNDYGLLQAQKAVMIAAHSHIIEFGLLSILLSFVQPYIYLNDRWKRLWVTMLLLGSILLPVFVLLELKIGLLAGGIADAGGLMVVVALLAMLVGVVRCTGRLDTEFGVQR